MKQCNGIKLEISKIQPTNTMLSEIRTKIIQKDKIIHIYVYTHYPCYSKAVSTESKLLVIKSYDMKILYVLCRHFSNLESNFDHNEFVFCVNIIC